MGDLRRRGPAGRLLHRGRSGGDGRGGPAIGTATFAASYSNIMDYLQILFENAGQLAWYQQPTKLAGIGLVAVVALNILFW